MKRGRRAGGPVPRAVAVRSRAGRPGDPPIVSAIARAVDAQRADPIGAILSLRRQLPLVVGRSLFFLTFDIALQRVWSEPTSDRAHAYARLLAEGVGSLVGSPARAAPIAYGVHLPSRVGRWVPSTCIGQGQGGRAFLAHDDATGWPVTLKLGSGLEGPFGVWFADDPPGAFLTVLDTGRALVDGEPLWWVARERADETWSDYAGRACATSGVAEILPIFRTACDGVADLNERHCHGWSAHGGNVFRCGRVWKLGDLHRATLCATPDDPRFQRFVAWITAMSSADREAATRDFFGAPWSEGIRNGVVADVGDYDRRLSQDDCSMLGGLLCELLGVDKWAIFLQALGQRLASSGAPYPLTGDTTQDTALSRILNRAWAGDAGGALALAFATSCTPYDDARQLYDDVAAALC